MYYLLYTVKHIFFNNCRFILALLLLFLLVRLHAYTNTHISGLIRASNYVKYIYMNCLIHVVYLFFVAILLRVTTKDIYTMFELNLDD